MKLGALAAEAAHVDRHERASGHSRPCRRVLVEDDAVLVLVARRLVDDRDAEAAAWRSERAVASSSPVTSGTALAGFGFGPVETAIRTAAARRSVVPAVGCSATTVPEGSDEATYAARTRKPAAWSRRRAEVCDRPTTPGTFADPAVVVVVGAPLVVELADSWTTKDGVEASKPEPDLVQAALEKAGTDEAVMIGDTPWDVEAARKAASRRFAC